jgi:hypothetical protein
MSHSALDLYTLGRGRLWKDALGYMLGVMRSTRIILLKGFSRNHYANLGTTRIISVLLNEIPRALCSKLTYLAQNSGEEVLCDLMMSVQSRQTGLRLNILSCNSRSFDHRGMIIRTLTALLLVADHRIACSTTSFG